MTVESIPDEFPASLSDAQSQSLSESESERIPLLPKANPASTPLPWAQLSVLFWIQLVEPLTSLVIYPFINKMVSEMPITGGDEAKMGYYAGLIETLFSVAQAMTVLYWSRLSDRIGRKPVILIGLLGSSISMALFGLSRSFGALVFSRCLAGALNGNQGVIKSVMGEITDDSNVAQAMALMPVVWNTGATVGPVLGGWLSNPHDRFPALFPSVFWATYPYALPCFVVALYCAITLVMAFGYLEESMKHHTRTHSPLSPSTSSNSIPDLDPEHGPDADTNTNKPLPLSKVLSSPLVRTTVLNYTLLAFLDIALRALQPLFLTSSLSSGGLGFSVPTVGTCLAAFFVGSGVYQAVAFAPVYRWLGRRRIFGVSVATFVGIWALFPGMRWSARRYVEKNGGRGGGEAGVGPLTWVMLAVQLVLYIVMDMGFSSAIIYIRLSAPNSRSLGVTNGIAQTAVSIARAVGPVFGTSLFAASIEHGWMGGNLVYVVLGVITMGAVWATRGLPP